MAEWTPGLTSTELIEHADRALLFGKQEGERGRVHVSSALPEAFRAGRFARHLQPEPAPMSDTAPVAWPDNGRAQTERLRKRTRQLALANALGTRLAAMTDPQSILDAAVDELHRAFGYFLCAVIGIRDDGTVHCAAGRGEAFVRLAEREWSQPRDVGLIGRCLRERRPVIEGEVTEQDDYMSTAETGDVRSELVVPLWVGDTLWGAINIEEMRPNAFDEDDARLVQTVADQVGSALRSAMLYKRLDSAYVGTAEALAAALEAKDSYSASHSHAVVHRTEAVGRRLGLSADELRILRFGAIFHDIGKIAVPEAILNKRGPLTEAERDEIKRHTLVGERILAAVDFLEPVLPLVRHEHERWDGRGYPDGLAGNDIPLGARIILACDAYDAMTNDRPYRPGDDRAPGARRAPGRRGEPVRRARGLGTSAGAGGRQACASARRESGQVVRPPALHGRRRAPESRLDRPPVTPGVARLRQVHACVGSPLCFEQREHGAAQHPGVARRRAGSAGAAPRATAERSPLACAAPGRRSG